MDQYCHLLIEMAQRPATAAPSLSAERTGQNQTLVDLLSGRRILLCVGPGGVGKTTVSATLALCGAALGRRTLVLTIDPARRLADALGLQALGHDIQRVQADKIAEVAARRGGSYDPRGSLDAMMLHQKRAFDEVVSRYARDETTRRRILANRIYQQVSTTLAGSHEYAAMSKLYDIARECDYELIVVDTPPTENALDFLDAPNRVAGAIDSPAIQWFIKPYLKAGTFSLKMVGLGGAFVLGRLARFTGSAFLEQMAQFFVEFNDVLGGFRERAQEVLQLMRDPQVAFLIICSPEVLSVDEALYFHDRLVRAQMPLGGFIVNRMHTRGPEAIGRQELVELLSARPELRGLSPADIVQVAADLHRTYREQQVMAEVDERTTRRLAEAAARARVPLRVVPLFEQDIYGMDGLALVSRHLLA
ncbi:MAG: ArsA-related P-loop ATPase [Myxococcales bacterium]|nr:ArsA-related P-loop ATPase [Myxococcales bacterium]